MVVEIDVSTEWSVAFVVRTINRVLQPTYYGFLIGLVMKYIFFNIDINISSPRSIFYQ